MTIGSAFVEKIKSGQLIAGMWMEIPHPMVAEIMAQVGTDFLLVDGEHAPIPTHRLLDLLPCTDRHGTPVIYRVAYNRPEYIKAALDTGAAGVMIPMVNTADEAKAAVAAAKYYPAGERGLGSWRASNYYQNFLEHTGNANDQTTVIFQIESMEAVRNIDAIAATPGVDVLYIGPGDLALSRGRTIGKVDTELLQVCGAVAKAAHKHGIIAGIDCTSIDYLDGYVQSGLSLFTHGMDFSYIVKGGRRTAAAVRERFEACSKR